ncbi:MAG: Primosomal protein [Parcubacteria group bacterium GW2011_GWF2_50_9]|nr:MAG: Primosomal protein [Parcubacteria group bacterium GW2011_GWF2_50_9]
MTKTIIEVAIPGLNVDTTFEYEVPEHLSSEAGAGKRTVLPFGNKTYTGVILSLKAESSYELDKIKPIISIVDDQPVLTDVLLKLAAWISVYYITSINRVLAFMIPSGAGIKSKKIIKSKILEHNDLLIELKTKKPEYYAVMDFIIKSGDIPYTTLDYHFKNSKLDTALNYLKKKEFIEFIQETEELKVVEEIKIFMTEKGKSNLVEELNPAQSKILELVKLHNGEYNSNEIQKTIGCSASPIKTLIKKGFIEVKLIKKSYELKDFYTEVEKNIVLNTAQENALYSILSSIERNSYEAFLLYGVTGSGKTEIYLQAIKRVIENGGDCIMLVPEISLTPQTVARFKNRFGDKISVLHSMLSPNERLEQWNKILSGEMRIVVGPRSAVFAPFKKLKLIIVDEEHENSYKQSESPAYNGRDAAVYRAYLEKCVIILGSATPTLESYHNALSGKYKLIELPQRASEDAVMPSVKICDIRNELVSSDTFVFSAELKNRVQSALENNQQIILFLNRRGFAPYVMCLNCGGSFKCPDCNVALTFHYENRSLVCHYCGFIILTEGKCPDCKSLALKFIGLGTEKIELACKFNFPGAIVERIDADNARKKNYLNRALEKFKNKQIDILVGTQILAKGLDFPDVTVIGIMFADITLNLPDFRAAERTFSLLTQVSGRAGRSFLTGNVVIQTLSPDHYSIINASNQDYKAFFNEEIILRKTYNYPPFTRLINIQFSAQNENKVKYYSRLLSETLIKKCGTSIKILGPAPAPIPKIKNMFRYQLLLKGVNLNFVKKILAEFYAENKNDHSRIFIDVDPQNLM